MDRELAEARRHNRNDAAWISARLRAGALTIADVELLSYLGHHGALALVGSKARRGNLFSWIRGLRAWHDGRGSEAALRAILAVGREVLRGAPAPTSPGERLFQERLARDIASVEYALEDREAEEPRSSSGGARDDFPAQAMKGVAQAASRGFVRFFVPYHRQRKRVIYRAAARTLEIWQRELRLPIDPRGLIRDDLAAWILGA